MKKQNLNTSVKVTDKKGNSIIYSTIEEAAEKSGLSIQALKLRANKNSIPKDGIQVEWMDEHTKRSYVAKRNKKKGCGLELNIVKDLKELGYDVCTSRAQSKNLDNNKVDICDMDGRLPVLIQAKCTQNTPNYFGIKSECPIKNLPFTIVWKKQESDGNSPGTVAIIPYEVFLDYLKLKS